MTPRDKADRAQQLLSDECLKEAFKDIKDKLIHRLEATPVGDVDTQHHIALTLQLLRQLRAQLEQYVQDQAVEEHKVKQDKWLDKMKQRLRA